MSLHPGAILDARYELLVRLGQGGQGSVWKAFDRNTDAHRALKIVDLRGGDEETTQRAHREARLVRGLGHPALVACHAVSVIPHEDLLVLVFDFVEATPLFDARADPRFDRVHKLAALRHIAGALAHLHDRGVVHRDLKPDNILLTPSFWEDPAAPSSLKIIDFGIATPRRGPEGSTLSGRFGTPPYMAPELFGVPDTGVLRSPARDVFAFGIIGWELLEGGHPAGLDRGASQGAYSASYEALRRGRSPWPPRTPAGTWGPVICASLALDAATRPRDGSALLALLGEAPAGSLRAGESSPAIGRAPPTPPPTPAIQGSTVAHAPPGPESTVPSAPILVRVTERALPSSLPQSVAPERTTPMPPEARNAAAPAPEIEVTERPSATLPSKTPPRRAPPGSSSAEETGSHWLGIAAIVVLTTVGLVAYLALVGNDARGGATSPTDPPPAADATAPPPVASPSPSLDVSARRPSPSSRSPAPAAR